MSATAIEPGANDRNVSSDVLRDVLNAAGEMEGEGIALTPEERLPLMIYAGTFNPKGMSKSPWPKVPGTYQEAIEGLAQWLKSGDEAVLLGEGVREGVRVSANEMAEHAGTIPYEILCKISHRIERVYV